MLDQDLIGTRRRELGLSERGFARRLGVTSGTVRALEEGRNHAQLTMAFISQVASVLEVQIADLIARQEPVSNPASQNLDLRSTLVAALLQADALVPQAELAKACSCTVIEVQTELQSLDAALGEVELRMHRTPSGSWGIRPKKELDREVSGSLRRALTRRRGFTTNEAKVLNSALTGDVVPPMSNAGLVAIGSLQKAGAIEQTAQGRVGLTAESRFSLLEAT